MIIALLHYLERRLSCLGWENGSSHCEAGWCTGTWRRSTDSSQNVKNTRLFKSTFSLEFQSFTKQRDFTLPVLCFKGTFPKLYSILFHSHAIARLINLSEIWKMIRIDSWITTALSSRVALVVLVMRVRVKCEPRTIIQTTCFHTSLQKQFIWKTGNLFRVVSRNYL